MKLSLGFCTAPPLAALLFQIKQQLLALCACLVMTALVQYMTLQQNTSLSVSAVAIGNEV